MTLARVKSWFAQDPGGGATSIAVSGVDVVGGPGNGLIAVITARDVGEIIEVGSVTFNGNEALAFVRRERSDQQSIELWTLPEPSNTKDAPASVVAAFAGGEVPNDAQIFVFEYTGTTGAMLGANAGTTRLGTFCTLPIETTAGGSLILWAFAVEEGVRTISFTAGGGTVLYNEETAGNTGSAIETIIGEESAAAAGLYSATASENVGAGDNWTAIAVEILAATGNVDATAHPVTASCDGRVGAVTAIAGTSVGSDGASAIGLVGSSIIVLGGMVVPVGVSSGGQIGAVEADIGGHVIGGIAGISGRGEVGAVRLALSTMIPLVGLQVATTVAPVAFFHWAEISFSSASWSADDAASIGWTRSLAAIGNWT